MTTEAKLLLSELHQAIRDHEKRHREKWTGPFHYREANHKIGEVRGKIFEYLKLPYDTVMSNFKLMVRLEKEI